MPSRLPEAPSVTQTATHIGDLGERRRRGETMRPAAGRPPPGKMPAAGSRRDGRLGGKGRQGAGGDASSVPSGSKVRCSGARSREPAAVWWRPGQDRAGLCSALLYRRPPGRQLGRAPPKAWSSDPDRAPSGGGGWGGGTTAGLGGIRPRRKGPAVGARTRWCRAHRPQAPGQDQAVGPLVQPQRRSPGEKSAAATSRRACS